MRGTEKYIGKIGFISRDFKTNILLTFHNSPYRSNEIEKLTFHRWRLKTILLN
jgi:hypothetical protein